MPELHHSSEGTIQHSLYKNLLQEYAQKAAIPLPVYGSINEGSAHAPMFRYTVEVDGQSYTSPNVFSHKKAAELDVARIAMENLPLKIREEKTALLPEKIFSLIQEETTLCKSILNEYAVKMHVERPLYKTETSNEVIPSFVSSIVFNGKQYVGDKGRTKKESQQLAARAVILSILDSGSCTVISEIIKSKKTLYAALVKFESSCNSQKDEMPGRLQEGPDVSTTPSTEKEHQVVALNDNMPRTAEPWTGDSSIVSEKHDSLHQFKTAKQEKSPFEPTATPMTFVASTSGKKRKHVSQKAKSKAEVDSHLENTPKSVASFYCLSSDGKKMGPFTLQFLNQLKEFDSSYKVWKAGQSEEDAILLHDALALFSAKQEMS